MAKRTTRKTPPPRPVETLKPVETVEVKPAEPALPPDSEWQWIIHEDTGELRQVAARAGYAPTPMPQGFRLAKSSEVPND